MLASELLPSWEGALKGQNRATKTWISYELAVQQLLAFIGDQEISDITTEAIRGFLADCVERLAPATARQRYASIKQFFKWAYEEGEITSDPMERIKAPHVPEKPVPILHKDEIARLLKACDGNDFLKRRDKAIIALFLDSGLRLEEMAGIRLTDLDMGLHVVVVKGKGSRIRSAPFSQEVWVLLDRYLRARRSHERRDSEFLWLGRRGALKANAIDEMLHRRADEANVEGLHAHRLRHSFAHYFLAAGGRESDLMMLAGWKSPQMVRRYASSTAADRAKNAHRELSAFSKMLS